MTRIISGLYKNRRLKTISHSDFRPTQDRVKELIFNVLGDIEDFRVVDLFAGSGNLGYEALSRGAREVIFVEISSQLIRCIEANAELLGVKDRVKIVKADAGKYALKLSEVDLVLADPPYDYPYKAQLCENVLAKAGVKFVLEADKFWSFPEELKKNLSLFKQIGDTIIYFFRI